MKILLFFLLASFALCHSWESRPNKLPESVSDATTPAADSLVLVNFATDIQPILEKKCNPCHFPGGKMFEAMPFDQAKTILAHPEGMQKRIHDGEEGRLLRAFLEQAGE